MVKTNDLSIIFNDSDSEFNDVDDSYDTHGTDGMTSNVQGCRDEVREVRKLSSQDTLRLRLWRIVVTGVLLLTALAITVTTDILLQRQEDENFQLAFEQFARSVGVAAVDEQKRMHQSFVGLANLISDAAWRENATWPMFRIPNYELHAGQVRIQTGMERIGFSYLVEPKLEDKYLDFVTANYEEMVEEGHMTRYGNLNRLTPVGYKRDFLTISSNGLVPDTIDRPVRWATWPISPPPSSYSSINWDINTLYEAVDLAWNELMNKTQYKELRATIFTNQAELIRFRKLVVNGVMATDIASILINWKSLRVDAGFCFQMSLPQNMNYNTAI